MQRHISAGMLGACPKSMARALVYHLPLHPSGHIDILWLPQWLVTVKLMSQPQAAGRTPPKKTEFKELKALGPHSSSRGGGIENFFPRGSGDGHFSGIDPWVFICLALCREQAASTRHVQDKCGRPPTDTARGGVQPASLQKCGARTRGSPQGSMWPRRGQLGTGFISFTDHWSPRETREWTLRLCPDARG